MSMFDSARQDKIVELLQEHKQISTNKLQEKLGVSGTTIRKDLDKLEKRGRLKRVYGGAVLPKNNKNPSYINFRNRFQQNIKEKEKIAEKASELLCESCSIILDASSTVSFLIPYLENKDRIKIITNGLYTAHEAQKIEGLEIFLIGGKLRPKYGAVEGLVGADIFKNLQGDFLFTSCHGFTIEKGLAELNFYEAQLKKEMVINSGKIIALVDHTKIGKTSTSSFAGSEEIDYLITDKNLSEDKMKALKERDVKILIAN